MAALYLVAIGQATAVAGARPRRWARNFFLGVTLLLNMAFVVRHAPSVPTAIRSNLLPALDTSFVFLLPTVIMLAIVAIESGARQLKIVRLQLLAETRMLERLVELDATAEHEELQAREHLGNNKAATSSPMWTPPSSTHTAEDASLPIADGSNATLPHQYACPKCRRALTMGKYAAARRYGHCAACKPGRQAGAKTAQD